MSSGARAAPVELGPQPGTVGAPQAHAVPKGGKAVAGHDSNVISWLSHVLFSCAAITVLACLLDWLRMGYMKGL